VITPSEQLGVWHAPLEHALLAQSAGAVQLLPGSHLPHAEPPQSMSLSSPFLTESLQVAATHTEPTQDRVTQSAPVLHPLVSPQAAHAPPQSTSVSPPFFRPSPQSAGKQRPAAHRPEAQSVGPLHPLSSPQPGQPSPPQSTSLSSPFLTESLQEGGWHV
jgi:hypothetical protein